MSLGVVALVAASGCAGFVPSGEVANASGHARVKSAQWVATSERAAPAECTNQPYEFEASDDLRHTRNEIFVRGMGEARAHARKRFGPVALAADLCRDVRGTALVAALVQDVAYAFRAFARAPLAAATIVATVAVVLTGCGDELCSFPAHVTLTALS